MTMAELDACLNDPDYLHQVVILTSFLYFKKGQVTVGRRDDGGTVPD